MPKSIQSNSVSHSPHFTALWNEVDPLQCMQIVKTACSYCGQQFAPCLLRYCTTHTAATAPSPTCAVPTVLIVQPAIQPTSHILSIKSSTYCQPSFVHAFMRSIVQSLQRLICSSFQSFCCIYLVYVLFSYIFLFSLFASLLCTYCYYILKQFRFQLVVAVVVIIIINYIIGLSVCRWVSWSIGWSVGRLVGLFAHNLSEKRN